MSKLLASGETELLEDFVSNKTRRKFKARLACDAKEGKVVFEFEPRPGRPPAKRRRLQARGRRPRAKARRPRPPLRAGKAAAKKAPAKKVAGPEGKDASTVAAKKAAL